MTWQEKLRADVREAAQKRVRHHYVDHINLVGLDDRSGVLTNVEMLNIIKSVQKAMVTK